MLASFIIPLEKVANWFNFLFDSVDNVVKSAARLVGQSSPLEQVIAILKGCLMLWSVQKSPQYMCYVFNHLPHVWESFHLPIKLPTNRKYSPLGKVFASDNG